MYVIPAETFGLFYREFRGCAGRSGLSFKCLSSYPDPVKSKCTASPLRSFLDSPVTSSLLGPNKTDHRDDIYYFVNGGILFRTVKVSGPGSSVGIATDCWLDGPGLNPGGDEIFRPSRPALGPTQSPVKWVPGLSWGLSAAGACC